MANLKISQLPTAATATTADQIAVVNEGVTSKITIEDIANLTAFGVSGNTSGTCISDIFVSTVNSCSPLIFKSGDQIIATLSQGSGFAIESGVNFVIPTGSEIVNGVGSPLVSEGSSSNRVNADGVDAISSDYWSGDIYRTSISGTSSGSTATTRYETSYQIGDNLKTESRWVIPDGSSPYITYQRSQGDKKLDANGMFYQMAGGSDNLNKEGTVCVCYGRPRAYGSACMGKCPLQLFESLKVESYINESNDAALYTVNAVNVDDDAIGTSFLHSNYSTALVNQTIFDTIGIYDNKLIIGDGSDIKNEKFYNTDSLVISESISGSTTGMTGTTVVFKEERDLIAGTTSRIVTHEECNTCLISSVNSYVLDTLLLTETLSGSSTGYTGTTKIIINERDLIAGTISSSIDGTVESTLSSTGLIINNTIKTSSGVFNFGSQSGSDIIPDTPLATTGTKGNMVSDGSYVYVRRISDGNWGRVALDFAW